jgi:hypothetical protein
MQLFHYVPRRRRCIIRARNMAETEAKWGTFPVSLYEHHDNLIPTLLDYHGLKRPSKLLVNSQFKTFITDLIRFLTVASGVTDDHRIRIVNFWKQSWYAQCSDESLTDIKAEPKQSGYASRSNTISTYVAKQWILLASLWRAQIT